MATLKLHCKRCDKPMRLKSEAPFGKKYIRVYTCGHSEFTERSVGDFSQADLDLINNSVNDPFELDRFNDDGGGNFEFVKPFIHESFWALDTCEPFFCNECQELHARHHAYEYQRIGVEFSEKSDHNCLIADGMGLGKTIQALLAVRRDPDLTPTIFVVKGSTQLQWCHQYMKWLDDTPLGVMPIMSRETIIPGFKAYVVSLDFIARKGVMERLTKLNAKLIVVDECQNIKNSSSDRTKAIIDWITKCDVPHKIFLSGTPIKNRASEYFTVLNLIDPVRFYSFTAFCKYWLIPNEKGIYTRIDPHMVDSFHELTKAYIIRREKRDVLKNLPKLLPRDFQYMTIEDPRIKNAYNNELDLFSNFQRTAGRINSTVLLGWLAKMRAITGQAKVPWAIEYTTEFMNNTEDSLLLGIQHQSVRDTLYLTFKTKGYDPLKFSGEDNIYAKECAKNAFMEKRNRLMIMNMIAGGVGVDGLQKACSNAVVLERQWNAADEEQFESRLDRDGQTIPCQFVYPIAKGTIDEWFHDGVEVKRRICAETMNDAIPVTEDEDFLNDLVNKTLENRL